MGEKNASRCGNKDPNNPNRCIPKILVAISLFSLFLIPAVMADNQYKPYLHEASVPEHPKVKLYGSYSTNLFPGAATYDYPIELPAGTGGLAPQLSLSYNSQTMQQRPGVMGAGWKLSQDYVYRDVNATPADQSDDSYKLVLGGSTYDLVFVPADGFYHTKIESFVRVQTLMGANNTYGMYWLVTMRDGTKYRFGYGSNSELVSDTGRSYVVRWNLDRVEDTHGNRIYYSYLKDPAPEDKGTAYLSSIEYDTEKARKVQFAYETLPRPDLRSSYESGNLVSESRRLAGISVYVGGSLVRRYAIDYVSLDAEGSVTSISAIKYFGSDGVSMLGQATFEYYQSAPGYTMQASQWTSPTSFSFEDNDFGVRYVDLNRDGFVDVVESRQKTSEGKVWINDGHGGWTDGTATWKLPLWLSVYDPTKSKSYYYYYQFAMIEPGQTIGLLQVNCPQTYGGGTVDNCDVISYDGYGNVNILATLAPGQSWYHCYPGDLTSRIYSACCDGTSMISPVSHEAYDCCSGKVTYNDMGNPSCQGELNHLYPTTLGTSNTWRWFYEAAYKMVDIDNGVRFVDFNNDGLPDIMQGIDGTRKAWTNTGSGWTDVSSQWAPPADFFQNYKDQGVQLVDLNGDGRVDIVQSMDDSTGVQYRHAWLNTGAGWKSAGTAWSAPAAFVIDGKDGGARMEDVNGDGLPDILLSNSTSTGAWLNTGAGWTDAPTWRPPSASTFITSNSRDGGVRFADVNGDGLVDMLEDYANGTTTDRGAWINNGHGWTFNAAWQSPEPFTKDNKNIGRRLADLNGDGQADISVAYTNSTGSYTWTWLRNRQTPFMLSKVTNMVGGTTQVGYAASTSFPNSGNDSLSDIGFNVWVVGSATSDNSVAGGFHVSSPTTYAYANGSYDYQDFEFRGFGNVQESLPDGSQARHYFYQDDNLKGIEYRTELSDAAGALYSRSESAFNVTKEMSIPGQPDPLPMEHPAVPLTLTINGTSVTLCGYNNTFSKIEVINGGTLIICAYDGNPKNCEGTSGSKSGCGYVKISTPNFTVDSTSYISGAGNGYTGGTGPISCGGGYWSGNSGLGPAGGGGASCGHYAIGNNAGVYGSPTTKEAEIGSGGGASANDYSMSTYGGDGGAALFINSTNCLISGIVDLTGATGNAVCDPSYYCAPSGSGAAGSVAMYCMNLNIDNARFKLYTNPASKDIGGHFKAWYSSISNTSVRILVNTTGSVYYEQNSSLFDTPPTPGDSPGQSAPIMLDNTSVPSENGVSQVLLSSKTSYLFDGQAGSPVTTKTAYSYDQYGNVVEKDMLGDVAVAGDEKTERYSYAVNTSAWIVDMPAEYQLFGADGRKAKDVAYAYDGLAFGGGVAKGDLTQVRAWLDTASGQDPVTSYAYDTYGNMVASTDPLGRTTTYSYGTRDATRTYPDSMTNALGQMTEFAYDLGTGNLLWTRFAGINKTYSYDVFGRVVKEVAPPDTDAAPTKTYAYAFDGAAPESIKVTAYPSAGKPLDTYYFYDGFGSLLQARSPADGGQQDIINLFYDGLGRVAKVQNPYFEASSSSLVAPQTTAGYAYYTSYTYDPLGRAVKVVGPDASMRTVSFNRNTIDDYDQNGHRHTYLLDGYGRIKNVIEYNDNPLQGQYSASESYSTAYSYDTSDNLVKIMDNAGNAFAFGYDSLGRKVSTTDPDIGVVNYAYDLADNLVSQKQTGGGNLVAGDGFYREYDALNQLVWIRNGTSAASPVLASYTYDPYGNRIKTELNDTARTKIYTPFPELMRIVNSTGAYDYTYVYENGALVARVNPDGKKYYYQGDHLGSTSVVTNATGNIVEQTSYSPFGEVLSGGKVDMKLYTGQLKDFSCQYYYGARYYNPCASLFTQPDSTMTIYNPQGLNRYSYALNNPYKYTDPSGHFVEIPAAVMIVGVSMMTVYSLYQMTIALQSMHFVWTLAPAVPVLTVPGPTAPALTPTPATPQSNGNVQPIITPNNLDKNIKDTLQNLPIQGSGESAPKKSSDGDVLVNTKKGAFTLIGHALKRALERGISIDEIKSIIENNPAIDYIQEGVTKVGYWDSETGHFVATAGDIIKTVMEDASQNYVLNLWYKSAWEGVGLA